MVSTRNPFPGMNPFLEQGWSDTHTLLVGYIRDALAQSGLPGALRARAEEALSIDEGEEAKQAARGDVAVVDSWREGIAPVWTPEKESAPIAVADPVLVPRERPIERWVEITTVHGRLVTVIEVLGPSNKSGPGRNRYLKKRDFYGEGEVNVVEIDLLRSGEPTVAGWARTPAEDTLYTICVLRAARAERLEVYHWGLRDRIPAFRVPLRAEDEDVALDLQPLVDRAYELGYYWQDNPQTARLHPRLSEEEAAFAEERLRAAGLLGSQGDG